MGNINKKYLTILVINLLVLILGLGIIVKTTLPSDSNAELQNQVSLFRVTFDLNMSENGFLIYDLNDPQKAIVDVVPAYGAEETSVNLPPGSYKISYRINKSVYNRKFIVDEVDSTKISLKDVKLPENIGLTEPAIIEELIDPLAHCEYLISRNYEEWHQGIDLAIAPNADCIIHAPAAGDVMFTGWSPDGEGYYIIIDHGNGIFTQYNHGEGDFKVKAGDKVKQGDELMHVGNTGASTGKHLHFEIKINGVNVNPANYIEFIS